MTVLRTILIFAACFCFQNTDYLVLFNKTVKVSNDKEIGGSEGNSHSKNQDGKN